MNRIGKLASTVALMLMALVPSSFVGAVDESSRPAYVGWTTAICSGIDFSVELQHGTSLSVFDPPAISEDGLYQMVEITSGRGWQPSCWMDNGAIVLGDGWVIYENPAAPIVEEAPPELIGQAYVNTDNVACWNGALYESGIKGYVPLNMWANLYSDGAIEPGWQYIATNDMDGILLMCYIEEVFLNEQPIEVFEPEPAPEITEQDQGGDVGGDLPDTPVTEPSEIPPTEATEEVLPVETTPVDQPFLADPLVEETPAPASTYTAGDPIIGLPSTGSGSGILFIYAERVVSAFFAAMLP